MSPVICLQFPEIIDTFSSLYQMMDSRVEVFGKLSRLQGKLDIMLSQVSIEELFTTILDKYK